MQHLAPDTCAQPEPPGTAPARPRHTPFRYVSTGAVLSTVRPHRDWSRRWGRSGIAETASLVVDVVSAPPGWAREVRWPSGTGADEVAWAETPVAEPV
jgi:hypothetical protein